MITTVNPSKERLLAAAKELFLARGYAATTVDAICEKAELTKGSFYYSFDSKEDEVMLPALSTGLLRTRIYQDILQLSLHTQQCLHINNSLMQQLG